MDNPVYEVPVVEKFTIEKGKHQGKEQTVLCIPTGGGYAFKFGLGKAKAILNNLEAIEKFVENDGKFL